MDQAINDIRAQRWEAVVLEANKSGMKKREWCRLHGVSERRFYYWQQKVRSRAVDNMKRNLPAATSEKLGGQRSDCSTFVELNAPEMDPWSEQVPACASVPKSRARTNLEGYEPELILEMDHCRLLIGKTVTREKLRTVMEAVLHA